MTEEEFNKQSDACYERLVEAVSEFDAPIAAMCAAKVIPALISYMNERCPALTERLLYMRVLHTVNEYGDGFRDVLVDFLEETHGE